MPRHILQILGFMAVVAFTSGVARAEARLVPSDLGYLDGYGETLAVDADTAIVGVRDQFLQGAAWVFDRDQGGPGAWGQVARLDDPAPVWQTGFGQSVAISGDTVVVGRRPDTPPGRAYVFERDQGGPDAWGLVATLVPADSQAGDDFGRRVAISGDTVLVGSTNDTYVFERDQGGPDAWGEVVKLSNSDGVELDGQSAISGDLAVVGAISAARAVAYVFARDQGGPDAWGEVAKLIPPYSGQNLSPGVAISGETVLVAPGVWPYTEPPAYLFERDQGGPDAWGLVAEFHDSEFGQDYRRFAIALDGDTMLLGSSQNDFWGLQLSGVVYVHSRNHGGSNAWGLVTKLTASDASRGRQFGAPVDVSGSTALISSFYVLPDPVYAIDLFQACGNGLDEDGDGLADHPFDPGCEAADDLSERSPFIACDDGADNDGDGYADFVDVDLDGLSEPPGDPACLAPGHYRENAACQDGIDNDGKPGTDYDGGESILGVGNGDPAGADPNCVGHPWRNSEAAGACGLGFEPALLLPLIVRIRRRVRGRRPDSSPR